MATWGTTGETAWSNFSSADASKYRGVLSFTPLTAPVQKHLQKVYSTLLGAVAAAAVGAYVHFLFGLGGILTTIGFVGCTIWLLSTQASPANEGSRLRLLLAAAALKGCTLGPLLEAVADLDASLIITAFVGTVLVFGCFSVAALLSPRREFLFLGGALFSGLSLLVAVGFVSRMLGGAAQFFTVELYAGLVIFVGYVLFDTQVIVEKANRGDRDYIKHTLELFIDLVGIFVRILIILVKNNQSRESRERQNREKKRNGDTNRR